MRIEIQSRRHGVIAILQQPSVTSLNAERLFTEFVIGGICTVADVLQARAEFRVLNDKGEWEVIAEPNDPEDLFGHGKTVCVIGANDQVVAAWRPEEEND